MSGERRRYHPEQQAHEPSETVVFDAAQDEKKGISRQAKWQQEIYKYANQGVPDAIAKRDGIRRRTRESMQRRRAAQREQNTQQSRLR